jgi:hypothetical protein
MSNLTQGQIKSSMASHLGIMQGSSSSISHPSPSKSFVFSWPMNNDLLLKLCSHASVFFCLMQILFLSSWHITANLLPGAVVPNL